MKRLEAAAFEQLLTSGISDQPPDHLIAAKLGENAGDLLGGLSRHAACKRCLSVLKSKNELPHPDQLKRIGRLSV